jgi:hypothetical protein
VPGFKAVKERLTLLLGGNASGNYRLKPLLIYHSENPRAFKGINKATLPIYYRSNRKAWITIPLFEDWFINCFIPEVEKITFLLEFCLFFDNAPGHPAHSDDFHPDVKVVSLPPNTISLIQPMDQGEMANFKAYYLRMTFAQALAATNRYTDMTCSEIFGSHAVFIKAF